MQSALLHVVGMLLRASTSRRLMTGGSGIVIGMLAKELISAHWIAAVIYHSRRPFPRAIIAYFVGAVPIAAQRC